ncbi:hypothetical protein BCV70DRAFT_97465 [Testicularia cyperi]|uniref:Uncharacterized protein n=1 Tax=Testicularia cyperi TaxID=1882483 RepID=A0A317XRQ0_9BASI|nr:hypothetical protein BCV70DRAFT_97465 [Testicularia cyperi]
MVSHVGGLYRTKAGRLMRLCVGPDVRCPRAWWMTRKEEIEISRNECARMDDLPMKSLRLRSAVVCERRQRHLCGWVRTHHAYRHRCLPQVQHCETQCRRCGVLLGHLSSTWPRLDDGRGGANEMNCRAWTSENVEGWLACCRECGWIAGCRSSEDNARLRDSRRGLRRQSGSSLLDYDDVRDDGSCWRKRVRN